MNKLNNQRQSAQLGLGLISALFVITVLALLAAGMASLSVSSAQTHTQQILNIRTQSAASSALQIYQAQTAKTMLCSTESVSYQYETEGLYDCRAELSCENVDYQGKSYITLKVDASCGTGIDSASTQLTERLIKRVTP
jgi:MSHA biogenesis protein MshP